MFQWNRENISLKGFIKAELPDTELSHLGDHRYSGKCPLPKHQEQQGESFFLDEGRGRCSCKGKCTLKGADISQIGAIIWDCTNTEAAKRIFEQRANYPRKRHWAHKGKKAKTRRNPNRWDWRKALLKFPKDEIWWLADLRKIPRRGIRRAIDLGLLWYLPANCNSVKSVSQGDAWVITDSSRQQAMRRRLNGQDWYGGAKSKLLPGCSGKTEIGLKEALNYREIIVVEGAPDLLAALGYFPNSGVICMASVITDFSWEARKELTKPQHQITIIPHRDEAGMKAFNRWSQQLFRAKVVEWIELPEGVKDFNDWLRPKVILR